MQKGVKVVVKNRLKIHIYDIKNRQSNGNAVIACPTTD